jgi:hypothetical protein
MQIYDERCPCGATGLILRNGRTSASWWGGRCGRSGEPPLIEDGTAGDYPRTCPVCGKRAATRDAGQNSR